LKRPPTLLTISSSFNASIIFQSFVGQVLQPDVSMLVTLEYLTYEMRIPCLVKISLISSTARSTVSFTT
jgi:hypothetical protein